MLNFSNLTVRLGGRTILDRASAALPPKARVGLIGRNGAGKSTLMKVMIGSMEADDGDLDKPRNLRIGYIAQEAPSGTTTPIEAVLAADTERAALGGFLGACAALDLLRADGRAATHRLGLQLGGQISAAVLRAVRHSQAGGREGIAAGRGGSRGA
jgi:ATPase subunit of ABC transporter with duplicated ATPase domains